MEIKENQTLTQSLAEARHIPNELKTEKIKALNFTHSHNKDVNIKTRNEKICYFEEIMLNLPAAKDS